MHPLVVPLAYVIPRADTLRTFQTGSDGTARVRGGSNLAKPWEAPEYRPVRATGDRFMGRNCLIKLDRSHSPDRDPPGSAVATLQLDHLVGA